jgi:hypothetical protein
MAAEVEAAGLATGITGAGVETTGAFAAGAGFFTAMGETGASWEEGVSGPSGAAVAAVIDLVAGGLGVETGAAGLGAADAGLATGAFAACAILAAALAKLGGTGVGFGFAAAAGAGVAGVEIFVADFFREGFLAMSGKINTLAGRNKPAPDFSA